MTEKKGCVYFFRHVGLEPIKIGYSSNSSPINRFNQFKTYAPFGAEIIGFIQTSEPKDIETKLHQKYAHKRLDGEWFLINEDECKNEIDFYTSKEDIRKRNEFQIAWAKSLHEKDIEKDIEQYQLKVLFKKEDYQNSVLYLEVKRIIDYLAIQKELDSFAVGDFLQVHRMIENPLRESKMFYESNAKLFIDSYIKTNNIYSNFEYVLRYRKWFKTDKLIKNKI